VFLYRFQLQFFSKLPEVLVRIGRSFTRFALPTTSYQGIMSATLIIMAVNDLFITAVLCWYLRKSQSTFTESVLCICFSDGQLTSVYALQDPRSNPITHRLYGRDRIIDQARLIEHCYLLLFDFL
jgi:hypothetical protein